MRKCLKCGKLKDKKLMNNGAVCDDCTEVYLKSLERSDTAKKESSVMDEWLGPIVVVAVMSILGWLLFAPSTPETTAEKKERIVKEQKEVSRKRDRECISKISGFDTAVGYVKTRLKVPLSAEFEAPYIHNVDKKSCQHIIKGYFRSENLFGVMLLKRYRAVVIYNKDEDKWFGRKLEIF